MARLLLLLKAGQPLGPAVQLLVKACTGLLQGLSRESEKERDNFCLESAEAYACSLERCLRICWVAAEEDAANGVTGAASCLRIPENLLMLAVKVRPPPPSLSLVVLPPPLVPYSHTHACLCSPSRPWSTI